MRPGNSFFRVGSDSFGVIFSVESGFLCIGFVPIVPTFWLDDIADDDGWAFLGDVGNLIVKKKPEFDPRNYGFSKLTPMLKSLTDILEIDERESDKKGIKHVYVRLRFT